jgi:hypothetical protein
MFFITFPFISYHVTVFAASLVGSLLRPLSSHYCVFLPISCHAVAAVEQCGSKTFEGQRQSHFETVALARHSTGKVKNSVSFPIKIMKTVRRIIQWHYYQLQGQKHMQLWSHMRFLLVRQPLDLRY